jgi:hypothetical protein
MTEEAKTADQARAVVASASAQLNSIDSSPFSAPAFGLLKEKIGQHIVELINESVKVSKRHRADTVSAAHVERASEYLVVSTARKVYRHLGTVGGVLLGAALSNLLSMSITSQYTGAGTILSAALGVIGAFMIALHIAKD